MAALLNSLSFAFTNSFLPKYRVKYDYLHTEEPPEAPSMYMKDLSMKHLPLKDEVL